MSEGFGPAVMRKLGWTIRNASAALQPLARAISGTLRDIAREELAANA